MTSVLRDLGKLIYFVLVFEMPLLLFRPNSMGLAANVVVAGLLGWDVSPELPLIGAIMIAYAMVLVVVTVLTLGAMCWHARVVRLYYNEAKHDC